MNKVLIILGSTSTGKTDLALNLAKIFNGELISVDSRQVYIGLDIGTGKMPGKSRSLKMENGRWMVDNIPIYLYDVVNPKRQYTVFNYIKDTRKAIRDIRKRNKLPIIVGGTGLYLKGLLEGFPNLGIAVNLSLRKKLDKLSLEKLQSRLQKISPEKWNLMNRSDRSNPRRLIRAIEIAKVKRLPVSLRGAPLASRCDSLKIGLTAPRGVLYQRIDKRIKSRINQGMIEEAESLHENGLSIKRMKQLGLEYGVLADFLQKKVTKVELVKILQRKIQSYAKRQITWFKKEKDISWFDITEKNYLKEVENLISKWYYQSNAPQD